MKLEYVNSKSIGSDLCTLARLLVQYKVCIDTSSLENAGQSCLHLGEGVTWKYDLDKITFRIDEVGGKIPFGAYDISASLTLKIEGSVPDLGMEIIDPLVSLSFDLEIEGFQDNSKENDLDKLYCAWHLDRHIGKKGDNKTKYSHPMYHFTFGGEKMEEKGEIFGDCLILPAPRISYPPMDAILGIDFILQNYLHKDKIDDIISDTEYISIIQRAQQRILRPYFLSLASFWNNEIFKDNKELYIYTQEQFSSKALFPLFY